MSSSAKSRPYAQRVKFRNGLAAVARDRGRFERAAMLIGVAEAMVESQGAEWPPDERVHYEQTLARSAAGMGSEAFERARAAGRAMSVSEAVRFALESA